MDKIIKDNDPDFGHEVEEVLGQNGNLPEAPMSIHIDTYYKGFHAGITIRSRENESLPTGKIVKAIDALISMGFEPSWNKSTSSEHLAPKAPSSSPSALTAPICGVHGTNMVWKEGVSKTTGKPYAFWSCPTRNANNSFCNWKPDMISKGYASQKDFEEATS